MLQRLYLLLLVCVLKSINIFSALSIAVALGVAMTMQEDAEKYFNESIGRKVEQSLLEEAINFLHF